MKGQLHHASTKAVFLTVHDMGSNRKCVVSISFPPLLLHSGETILRSTQFKI